MRISLPIQIVNLLLGKHGVGQGRLSAVKERILRTLKE
jgi:hypothetical protein